jgi:hypothetical protein
MASVIVHFHPDEDELSGIRYRWLISGLYSAGNVVSTVHASFGKDCPEG